MSASHYTYLLTHLAGTLPKRSRYARGALLMRTRDDREALALVEKSAPALILM